MTDETNTAETETTVENTGEGDTTEQAVVDPIDTETNDAAKSVVDELGGYDDETGEDDAGAEVEGETAEGASEETSEETTEESALSSAISSLVDSGMTLAQIKILSDEQILQMGSMGVTDDAGSSGEAENTDGEQETTEADDAVVSKTAEEITAAVIEEMGDAFDADETKAIAAAVSKAVGMQGQPSFDLAPYKAEIESSVSDIKSMMPALSQLMREVETLSVQSSRNRLSEVYPQLSDDANMEKVVAKASSFMKNAKSVDEAIEMAALSLYGRDQTKAIKKHAQKVSRAKSNGTPNTRGVRDGKSTLNETDDAVKRIVSQNM